MRKYVVLTLLPQGQRPGALIELHPDAGQVFLSIGAVRTATPSDDKKTPEQRLRARGEYARRDLTAEV